MTMPNAQFEAFVDATGYRTVILGFAVAAGLSTMS